MTLTERVFALLLLAIAFTVRILPLTWGQPDPTFARSFHGKGMIHEQTPLHPDEYFFTAVPFRKVLEPQSNFTFYENPSFLVNVSYVVARLSGVGQGLDPRDRAGLNERYYAPFSLYILTRTLSALGGVLAVAAAYALARRIGGAWAAWLAGLLATFSLPLVAHAHYGTTSSPATGFATASLFFAVAALFARRERMQDALLMAAGVAAGLAMGNRYNAAVVSLGVLLVGLWLIWQRRSVRGALGVLIAFALFPLTFLITTPGALLDTEQFLSEIRYVSNMYLGTGTDGRINLSVWEGLLVMLGFIALYGVGPVGVLLLGGLARLRGTDRRVLASVGLIALYVAVYALLVLRTVRPSGADHLTLPILPALAVLIGVGGAAISRSWRMWPRVGLALALVAFPLYLSMAHLRIITQPDTREVMQRWIYDHVPRGSRFLLVGSINVALDPADYPWDHVFALPEQVDYAAYPNADFLLISEAFMETHRKMGRTVGLVLPEGAQPVAVIYRPPRLGSEHPAFTSDYFHSPTIRLFCLNAVACDATIPTRLGN
jgi:hypothetical protein